MTQPAQSATSNALNDACLLLAEAHSLLTGSQASAQFDDMCGYLGDRIVEFLKLIPGPGTTTADLAKELGAPEHEAQRIQTRVESLAAGGPKSIPSAIEQKPVDPESEAANPVWDLVIHTCAQAWPAGTITWSQSPTELIVQIINERDEARQQVKELLEKGL